MRGRRLKVMSSGLCDEFVSVESPLLECEKLNDCSISL